MQSRLGSIAVWTFFAITAIVASWQSWPTERVKQPVQFPHARHIALDIDCAACHTGSREGTHAGIPLTQTCVLCHQVNRSYPPTPLELAKYIESGKEIPWVQLHKAPRHVFFSHQRHVTLAKLDCAVCHGDMKTALEPVTHAFFPSGQPGMDRCIDCHRAEKVSTDCLSCHR